MSSQVPVLTPETALIPPTPIKNLCCLLQRGKESASGCYGSITDTSREFNLYAQRCHSKTNIAVHLRKILEEQKRCTWRFDYPERVKVALALSYSVFHHYNTPWLTKIITTDHVRLFREEPTQNMSTSNYLGQATVEKTVTNPAGECNLEFYVSNCRAVFRDRQTNHLDTLVARIPPNTNYPRQHCRRAGDHGRDRPRLEKQERASELSEGRHVLTNGGPNYAAAARWCLNSFLKGASLEDENFCREFHGEVVERLETVFLGCTDLVNNIVYYFYPKAFAGPFMQRYELMRPLVGSVNASMYASLDHRGTSGRIRQL